MNIYNIFIQKISPKKPIVNEKKQTVYVYVDKKKVC